jgi:hypothetical protein
MVNQNAGRVTVQRLIIVLLKGFQFFGTAITNQNSIWEEKYSTLQSGNACCHLVKNLLSSFLLSKTMKIKMFLYGYENCCLALKEEHMQKEFQNKVLRRIFVPKRDKITVKWRELYSEEQLKDMYCSPNTVQVIKSRRMRWVWQ